MNQALYAHMNNKRKMKKKKVGCLSLPHVLHGEIGSSNLESRSLASLQLVIGPVKSTFFHL
jgi:hypothetical protein